MGRGVLTLCLVTILGSHCENKTHVAKQMPHTFATVAKSFSDDHNIWRERFPPMPGWAYLGRVQAEECRRHRLLRHKWLISKWSRHS